MVRPFQRQKVSVLIVVVVESSVKPEQADQALQSAQEGLRQSLLRSEGRRQSRFFQSRSDPGSFLYLGIWENREAYDEQLQTRQRDSNDLAMPEPLRLRPRYFRILSTFERMMTPMEVVVCQTVSAPAGAASTLREFFASLFARRAEAGPGLILSLMCQEIDAPGNFLLVSGWRSLEALTAGSAPVRDDFDRQLETVGATYHRFIGQTRYDSVLQGRAGGADQAS